MIYPRSFFLFATLYITTLTAYAQIGGSIVLGSGYDDNAFSNATASESPFASAGFEIGYYPEETNFAISYSGLFASYNNFPDRHYALHSAYTSYILPYGADKRNQAYIGGSLGLRIDGEAYNYYDYRQAQAYIGLRHYLGDILNGNVGYSIRFRAYQNFSDMSYTEHIGWLGGNTSFESGTSVVLRAEIGVKNYSPISSYSTDGTATENNIPSTSGVTANGLAIEGGGPGGGGNSGGNGKGGSGSGNSNAGNGMRLRQVNNGTSTSMGESVQIITFDDATTAQLRASITVGQSLTETTGLSLSYLHRFNINERSRAVVGGTVDFIGEEELFDDPYSYESDEVTLKLTQILPASMKLQVAGYFLLKEYTYNSDIENIASDMRNDRKYGAWLALSKTISGNWLLFSGLDLTIGYTYIRNESNTPWYDYSGNDVAFSIGTDF